MIITIIMMNIKSIFITTGITVLFGVYSVYNILEYLRELNNFRVKQIIDLKHLADEYNSNYHNLLVKHTDLKQQYDDLMHRYKNVELEMKLLHVKIDELQQTENSNDVLCKSEVCSEAGTNTPPIENQIVACDQMCDLNDDVPRIHMETMGSFLKTIDVERDLAFFSSRHSEHTFNTEYTFNNTEVSSLCGSEKSFVLPRSRSTSVTEINWTAITKKFLFG